MIAPFYHNTVRHLTSETNEHNAAVHICAYCFYNHYDLMQHAAFTVQVWNDSWVLFIYLLNLYLTREKHLQSDPPVTFVQV